MGIRQLLSHAENVGLLVLHGHKLSKYKLSKLYFRSSGGRCVNKRDKSPGRETEPM